jgi:GDPmannose 4,6-dehydratase
LLSPVLLKRNPMKDTKKVALVTGIYGQDGSYAAELLLDKGYEVHGISREKHEKPYAKALESRRKIHLGDIKDKAFID